MPKTAVFAIVVFLHDLFTAIWIGGLITLGLTVLPAARQVLGKGPEMKALLAAIQRRLSVLVYVSIAGLIVTGVLQAQRNPAFEGLFTFGNAYSTVLTLKHIVVVLMIGIALFRSLVVTFATFRSVPRPTSASYCMVSVTAEAAAGDGVS